LPIPADEYPLHQAPYSLAFPASSDRNFYDRCYLNCFDTQGEILLITGLGQYPNLGATDAFACARIGDKQFTVRTSDALGPDRMNQQVGPYKLEIVKPLEELHITLDGDEWGVGLDLHWTGSYAAVDESPHIMRAGPKVMLDAQRFAQVGTWEGEIRVDGKTYNVTPDRFVGTRDRSWGIRPVGEPEPAGRTTAEPVEGGGFYWCYVPLRFDDFGLVFITHEDAFGHRLLNDALRVWPDGRVETLGYPKYEVNYRSGTRIPESARITAYEVDGSPFVIDIETINHVALSAGCGYGPDPQWTHGLWNGRGWTEGAVYDLNDPSNLIATQYAMLDHLAKATVNGKVGYGLFEHTCAGRHLPSGFTDGAQMAP